MDQEELLRSAIVRRRFNGAVLRHFRQLTGTTQAAIGSTVGVDQSEVSRWELGTRNPRPEHAERLASLLDALARVVSS